MAPSGSVQAAVQSVIWSRLRSVCHLVQAAVQSVIWSRLRPVCYLVQAAAQSVIWQMEPLGTAGDRHRRNFQLRIGGSHGGPPRQWDVMAERYFTHHDVTPPTNSCLHDGNDCKTDPG